MSESLPNGLLVEHGEGAETSRIGEVQPLYASTRASGETTSGFYVADDGVGILADIRDEVFDSGFTTAAESTGFGLAIVAQVAEAHGWAATVTESPGDGARFAFTQQPAIDVG